MLCHLLTGASKFWHNLFKAFEWCSNYTFYPALPICDSDIGRYVYPIVGSMTPDESMTYYQVDTSKVILQDNFSYWQSLIFWKWYDKVTWKIAIQDWVGNLKKYFFLIFKSGEELIIKIGSIWLLDISGISELSNNRSYQNMLWILLRKNNVINQLIFSKIEMAFS